MFNLPIVDDGETREEKRRHRNESKRPPKPLGRGRSVEVTFDLGPRDQHGPFDAANQDVTNPSEEPHSHILPCDAGHDRDAETRDSRPSYKRIKPLHFCLTLKMSHGAGWRGACESTIRDRQRRWLWRLVRQGRAIADSPCRVGDSRRLKRHAESRSHVSATAATRRHTNDQAATRSTSRTSAPRFAFSCQTLRAAGSVAESLTLRRHWRQLFQTLSKLAHRFLLLAQTRNTQTRRHVYPAERLRSDTAARSADVVCADWIGLLHFFCSIFCVSSMIRARR